MFNPWPVVRADLRQNRAAGLAIVLLVAVAVALGVAVSAQERALRQGSAAAADPFDILIGAPGSETQLVLTTVYLDIAALDLIPGAVLAELQANPQVAFATPLAFGDSYRAYPIVGTTAEWIQHAAGGRPLHGRTFERIDEVVVGAKVDLALGDRFVPLHGVVASDEGAEHGGFHYHVVGRMPPMGGPWDQAIVATVEGVWWLHGLPVGHRLDPAAVWPQGPAGEADLRTIPIGPPWDEALLAAVPAIVASPTGFAEAYQIRQTYRSRDDTMAVFPAEVLIRVYGLLGDVRDLLAVVSVLTQTLVIGAILLAVLASLAQRRKLIAVLRALGASRGYVFATVWATVATLLSLGAALGLLLGIATAAIVGRVVEVRSGIAMPLAVSAQEVVLVLTIVAIGLVLATIPAALVYRTSIAATLRN